MQMTEREQFEAWWPSVGQTIGKAAAWEAWQAARATFKVPQPEHGLQDFQCQCWWCIRAAYKQALPQVPEGMALVPVELLERLQRFTEAAAEQYSGMNDEICQSYSEPWREGVRLCGELTEVMGSTP